MDSGYVSSPGYLQHSVRDYPLKKICVYHFRGIYSQQQKERVHIHFNVFHIPREGTNKTKYIPLSYVELNLILRQFFLRKMLETQIDPQTFYILCYS